MSSAPRIFGRLAALLIAAGLLAPGCTRHAAAPNADQIDPAVALFLEGRYDESLSALEALLDREPAEAVRREILYYVGRCHLEGGRVREAGEAFAAAVALGDRGASLDYLESLRPQIEGTARAVERVSAITRGQLCALVERWVSEGTGREARADPMRAAVESGWLRTPPDGDPHPEALLTRASFHVFVLRLCRDVGCVDGAATLRYPLGEGPLSGRDVIAALERVLPWPPPDAR